MHIRLFILPGAGPKEGEVHTEQAAVELDSSDVVYVHGPVSESCNGGQGGNTLTQFSVSSTAQFRQ